MKNTSEIKSLLYVRVSTSKQKTERQVSELTEMVARDGGSLVGKFSDKISGTKRLFDRESGSLLKGMIERGEVDVIYTHEVSRLGRLVSDVSSVVEFLVKHKVNLRVLNSGLSLFRNGVYDPNAAMMINMMVTMAQNERDTLSMRIKSGLKQAVKNGVKLGNSRHPKTDEVIQLILQNKSFNQIKKITGIGKTTFYRIKKSVL
jgi:DNA invertase Pin-like site-specific DNA recombinase